MTDSSNFSLNSLVDQNVFDQLSPDMFDLPETTTATIEQYVPQIGETWTVGTQLATLEAIPYARIYSLLSFPKSDTSLDLIELGNYSEEYEGSNYFLLANHFLEASYSSSTPFNKWEKTITKYRQELTYSNTLLSSLIWNRPSTQVANLPEILPPLLTQYSSLTIPYTLPLISVGKALRAEITVTPSNSQIQVKLKASPTEAGTLVNGSILLTQPYLEITLLSVGNPPVIPTLIPVDNTGVTHTSITIDFYGNYKWRSYTPLSTEDEKVLIHPPNASNSTKLKPPGHPELPDNFWNSKTNPLIFKGFDFRQNSAPRWN